ncbi:hypothetical protein FQA39_LY02397 [Lamprigera yunnana]|nr:hypothetical protein FQA39_LY02397 [Lamprigera yunnana]
MVDEVHVRDADLERLEADCYYEQLNVYEQAVIDGNETENKLFTSYREDVFTQRHNYAEKSTSSVVSMVDEVHVRDADLERLEADCYYEQLNVYEQAVIDGNETENKLFTSYREDVFTQRHNYAEKSTSSVVSVV